VCVCVTNVHTGAEGGTCAQRVAGIELSAYGLEVSRASRDPLSITHSTFHCACVFPTQVRYFASHSRCGGLPTPEVDHAQQHYSASIALLDEYVVGTLRGRRAKPG
jgi:hypothetical protein